MSNNKKVVLVMGPPNTGKSTALMQIKKQQEWVYLNADLKDLPFKDNFAMNVEIADAPDVIDYIKEIESQPGIRGAILDTVSFLMAMYERQYVTYAADTQSAWGGYGNFYREFIHEIKAGSKDYAILAHEAVTHNEQTMSMESSVPVKGAVGRIGVEADFTTILSTKQMPLEKLKGFENDLLHISPEEEEDGFKYVFCTRITKEHVGQKMRSAIGLWDRKELYIDNDIEQVFTRLNQYYGTSTEAAA
jgi:hypothetical protein